MNTFKKYFFVISLSTFVFSASVAAEQINTAKTFYNPSMDNSRVWISQNDLESSLSTNPSFHASAAFDTIKTAFADKQADEITHNDHMVKAIDLWSSAIANESPKASLVWDHLTSNNKGVVSNNTDTASIPLSKLMKWDHLTSNKESGDLDFRTIKNYGFTDTINPSLSFLTAREIAKPVFNEKHIGYTAPIVANIRPVWDHLTGKAHILKNASMDTTFRNDYKLARWDHLTSQSIGF